ncbi:MAG: DNA translocase FtsK, partial [Patescibacteria group bacterium]
KRIQGGYIDDNEIKKIVNYIKEKCGEPNYVEGITDRQKVGGIGGVGLGGVGNDDSDDLLLEAKEMVINSGKASASYLQRRLSVGYARAARLLDLLEEAGVVGPSNGSKPREIMITKEQYENMIDQGVSGVSLHNREEAVAPDEYLGGSDEDGEDDIENEESENDGEIEKEAEDDLLIHDEIKNTPFQKVGEGDFDDENKYFSR